MVLLFPKHILVALNLDQLLCNTCIMYLKKTFQDCLLRPKFSLNASEVSASVAKQYSSQRLWQFPLLLPSRKIWLERESKISFILCDKWWKVIKSEMLLPENQRSARPFLLLFSGRKPYFAQQEYLPKKSLQCLSNLLRVPAFLSSVRLTILNQKLL